jgi:uncharacterized integral membrane protein
MHRWSRIAGIAAIVILAGVFALLNSGERVTVYLGFTILYRISLVGLIFFAFLLGMITMMLVSLRNDLRIRRLLRERGLLDPPREAFRPEPPPESPP